MKLEGNHISLDLETLGTVPGEAIISIGACAFDLLGIHNQFYRVISVEDSKAHDMGINTSTLAWWLTQSGEARATVVEALMGGGHVGETIDELALWVKSIHNLQGVWTNGPAFDSAFIAVAAARTGRKMPWHYGLDRDFRTLKQISGQSWDEIQTEGVAHNALADAKNQAQFIIKAHERLHRTEILAAAYAEQAVPMGALAVGGVPQPDLYAQHNLTPFVDSE